MPLLFIHGDITTQTTDAIVNAANPWLAGGGGVDGAIHRAAGPRMHEACVALGGCAVGEAKLTEGFDLPCRYVIHTPGPVWHGGTNGEAKLLANCYTNSLRLAMENNCESVSFPLISTGAYGYPREEALQVATDAINAFLAENDMTVYLVFYNGTTLGLRDRLFREISESLTNGFIDNFPSDGMGIASKENFGSSFDTVSRREDRKKGHLLSAPRKAEKASLLTDEAPRVYEAADMCLAPSDAPMGLDEFLQREDEGFRGMLIRKIEEKGWTDAQCYRKANIDRRLFNHIINDKSHNPKKKTVFAFILALELDDPEAHEMLEKAGYAFAPSVTDRIILWCIRHREYDITRINEILFEYDQELLS